MDSEMDTDSLSSKLYVVLLHDGDEPFPDDAEVFDISAHYYGIYTIPIPDDGTDSDRTNSDGGSSPPLPPEKKPKLSSEMTPNLVATLSLGDFPHYMSFAYVGSYIYMFGGWKCTEGTLQSKYPPRSSSFSSPSLDTYIIDTTRLPDQPITPLSLKPGDSFVLKGPSLHTLKNCSYTVSHLGKIFAIPTKLGYEGKECAEVLDLTTKPNQWLSILNPPLESYHSIVGSCSVVGSHIVVVTSFDASVYELDATDPEKGWKLSTEELRNMNVIGGGNSISVIDGLLCPWFPVHRLPRDVCFMAFSLEDFRKFYYYEGWELEDIVVCNPSSGMRMGGEIKFGLRSVFELGDGRVGILTSGFPNEAQPLEFHLVLDIVRLEKREKEDTDTDGAVEIHPLRSFDHKIDQVKSQYVNICAFFPMIRSTRPYPAPPPPCVAWYDDIVIRSRMLKQMDKTEFPLNFYID